MIYLYFLFVNVRGGAWSKLLGEYHGEGTENMSYFLSNCTMYNTKPHGIIKRLCARENFTVKCPGMSGEGYTGGN